MSIRISQSTVHVWCHIAITSNGIRLCKFDGYTVWTYMRNIQWKWPLNVCILRGLLLRDSSPMCKKCCCVFVHRNTLDNDSERTISSLYSLKVFLPISSQFIGCSGEVVLSGVVVTTDNVVVSIAVLPVVNGNSHEETTICVP